MVDQTQKLHLPHQTRMSICHRSMTLSVGACWQPKISVCNFHGCYMSPLPPAPTMPLEIFTWSILGNTSCKNTCITYFLAVDAPDILVTFPMLEDPRVLQVKDMHYIFGIFTPLRIDHVCEKFARMVRFSLLSTVQIGLHKTWNEDWPPLESYTTPAKNPLFQARVSRLIADCLSREFIQLVPTHQIDGQADLPDDMITIPCLSLMVVVRYQAWAQQRIGVVNPVLFGIDVVTAAFAGWGLDTLRWHSEINANHEKTDNSSPVGGIHPRRGLLFRPRNSGWRPMMSPPL